MSSGLSEFELIERYFRQLGEKLEEVALGIGDDCAIIDLPEGKQLCLSIDTMVEGIHFPHNCSPELIGYRAFAAALSDLAAMGAQASHFSLALTLPKNDEDWLASFTKGLSSLANRHNVALVGGDTTRGPLTVSIQVHGFVPAGRALTRRAAKPGDMLVTTGTLGDSGGGLALIGKSGLSQSQCFLLDRYYRPIPRLLEGLNINAIANACIDVSDGLLADAYHIAEASKCQLVVEQELLPISPALRDVFPEDAIRFALSAGDDYELLFTLPELQWESLNQSDSEGIFTKIGYVVEGEGVKLMSNGNEVSVEQKGYRHFD